jgi:hypothetical protein
MLLLLLLLLLVFVFVTDEMITIPAGPAEVLGFDRAMCQWKRQQGEGFIGGEGNEAHHPFIIALYILQI